MFTNIGNKIKTLAKVLCWVSFALYVIGSIVGGIAVTGGFRHNIVLGIVIIVFGSIIGFLFAWIGSFLLYGFGELIDKTNKIEENTRH